MLHGIQSVAGVAGMFIFAIVYFGIVSDAGMLTLSSTGFCEPLAVIQPESRSAPRCLLCWFTWMDPAR